MCADYSRKSGELENVCCADHDSLFPMELVGLTTHMSLLNACGYITECASKYYVFRDGRKRNWKLYGIGDGITSTV